MITRRVCDFVEIILKTQLCSKFRCNLAFMKIQLKLRLKLRNQATWSDLIITIFCLKKHLRGALQSLQDQLSWRRTSACSSEWSVRIVRWVKEEISNAFRIDLNIPYDRAPIIYGVTQAYSNYSNELCDMAREIWLQNFQAPQIVHWSLSVEELRLFLGKDPLLVKSLEDCR